MVDGAELPQLLICENIEPSQNGQSPVTLGAVDGHSLNPVASYQSMGATSEIQKGRFVIRVNNVPCCHALLTEIPWESKSMLDPALTGGRWL
jgi:hypothetical protein